jgi:SAM-dependent methyltransferase
MKQEDIRPAEIWDRYLAAVKEDIRDMFPDPSRLASVPCPACGDGRQAPAFEKDGFAYVTCVGCRSLYMNPRPSPGALGRFYTEGKASAVWAKDFYPATAKRRKETIVLERVRFLEARAREAGLALGSVMDIGCGYGTFLSVLKREIPSARVLGVEPGRELAEESRAKGLEVVEALFEDLGSEWDSSADVATCFEVLEHLQDPLPFLSKVAGVLRPGGMAWFTSLGCDGFDVQALWGEHKNIYPPCHINILSLAGMESLARRAGFAKVDFVTPGKLDVDIVRSAPRRDPERLGAFLSDLLERGREEDLAALQESLVRMRRSSHVWILASK